MEIEGIDQIKDINIIIGSNKDISTIDGITLLQNAFNGNLDQDVIDENSLADIKPPYNQDYIDKYKRIKKLIIRVKYGTGYIATSYCEYQIALSKLHDLTNLNFTIIQINKMIKNESILNLKQNHLLFINIFTHLIK